MNPDHFEKKILILELDNVEYKLRRMQRDYNEYFTLKGKTFSEECDLEYDQWVTHAKKTMDDWVKKEFNFINLARNSLKESIKQ